MTPNNERQKAWRNRRADRLARQQSVIERAHAMLDGNDKPLAVKLRAVLDEGLWK